MWSLPSFRNYGKDARKQVWVSLGNHRRPGLLIEEYENEAVVYFPNAPDPNIGKVIVVDIHLVKAMDKDAR